MKKKIMEENCEWGCSIRSVIFPSQSQLRHFATPTKPKTMEDSVEFFLFSMPISQMHNCTYSQWMPISFGPRSLLEI